MTPLDSDDYRLSMAISPRAVREDDNADLRVLLVHRLHDSLKAVRRWALRSNSSSTYCENCARWVRHSSSDATAPTVPAEWRCPYCEKRWGVELIVYGELEPDRQEKATDD